MSIDPIDVPDPVNILQRIENEHDLADNQKDRIKAVKTELWFLGVLFRVQPDMTLKSFLTYAEDLFRKDYYIIGGSKDPRKFEHDTSEVLATIQSFKWRNIEKFFHVKISGSSPQSHELVMEVIDNVVQNLDNLLIVRLGKPPVVSMYFEVKALIELVKEELRALKNFVCFMEKFSSELKSRWQKFLCHVEVLAIHTACICFLNLPEPQDSKSVAPKFTNLVSDLLEKRIKPIEPGVRKIYTGILKNVLSSSTPPMFSIEPATGFIETLLHISTKLREVFPLNIDTTEILPEQQLNTLTVIVNELPLINNIQDSMRIRFFKRVENLVIHAGLVVYSLCNIRRNNGERKRDLLLLAEKIQRVKTEIYRDIREEVQSLLPKNDTLGFFDFLIGSLKELLYSHYDSLASLKYQLEVVYEELESLETSLKGIAARGIDKREELQDFTARLINKAYEVEYIIGSFVMTEIPHTYLKIWLSDIIKEIKLIKTELTELEEKKEEKTASPAAGKDQLVGFGEVRETIKGRLLGGSRNLDVIPIIGMPGIGKTTLAQSFKDDKEIVSHFSFRGECRVSQVYTRRYLLFSILSDANDERTYRSEEDDSELAARLKKVLFRKGRYLLIIDDVWQTNAWDDLSTCFPDTEGSRIILTTRHQIVASYAKCFTDPYHLRMLTGEESWLLLQRKIFGEEICPEELKEIGEEIAKKCKGLPLSIVLVGGLLARMEKKEQRWKQMELSLGAKIEDESKDLVQVSYKNLPHKMKPCFLYFGAFLEDREILVSKLTNLWIAEGLIENDKEKALEDIAEEYLEDLVGRNLVIVTKRRYNGKLKACLVHDIVLEFCKGKAEKENFLLWLKRDHDANLPDNFSQKPRQRRLLFYCDRDNLAGWSTSCSHARSILFREVGDNTFSSMKQASNFFANFKFVRVLDLEYIDVDSFPTDLNHLRYLALRTTKNSVPSSIENLWNLETFIVRRIGGTVLLPDTFWKLARLRHVFISDKAVFKLQGAKEILYGSHSKLENLAVLSTPCFSSAENMEKTVKKTPNLRKLRCVFAKSWGSGKNKNRFPVLHSLSRLESLKLLFSHIPQVGPSTFNLPPRLKKLTLCNFPLPLAEISTIANLRELEVLKLHVVEFENEEWEVRDIEFPQLKFLKLEYIQLKTWGVSEEAFPCLQQLVLHSLFLDQGIPSYFGEMVHLKYIEVKSCNTDVEDSARDIEETQVDTYQNCDFKVSVQS